MNIVIAALFLASSVFAQTAGPPPAQTSPPQASPQTMPAGPPQGPPPRNLVRRPDGRFTANEDPANPERFEVHVVAPGDTLSTIAARVLNNARLWPQLWEQNEHIINPHWIYPNDKILIRPITTITEAVPPPAPAPPPPLEPAPAPAPAPEPPPPPPPAPPREGLFRLDQQRQAPEVKPADMYCSGFVRRAPVPMDFKVIAKQAADGSALATEGDYVYIGQGSEDGIQVGSKFQVVRPTKRLESKSGPTKDERNLGMHYLDIGHVQVIMTQPDFSLARVIQNCEAAELGDLLLPFQELPAPVPPRPRQFSPLMTTPGDVKGSIVISRNALTNFGSVFKGSGITPGVRSGDIGPLESGISEEGSIVYLNVGSDHGVKSGDLFIVYREVTVATELYRNAADTGKLKGQRTAIGELVVLKVGERAATALVTYASDGLLEGDPVERR